MMWLQTDASTAPEWAVRLAEKLTRLCDSITERNCPNISLRPVGPYNWYACTQLEVTEEQKTLFPVPAVYWLAESAYCGFTPLAVYTGEQLAGLAVYAVDPDDGCYWIMAYMIDRHFQSRGLGRAGMKALIRYMAEAHGCHTIRLGHRPENGTAASLYASLGFRQMECCENEIVRELNIPSR
ncbi:GNAT family N-acetyltransferase [Paenibacillus nanensis]|uniref:GNAT family N-acetyltransferase n=1 Tax=Paenibacillus nanensis TaxID=393251 RepID=A0A3A1VIP4_9BACL|nr:GNAT family N-acetyltransferase [Paenibacillus nanensis]RIX60367.1 GNAT family N-acetyltransferase [Paenibacillus nanensis]